MNSKIMISGILVAVSLFSVSSFAKDFLTPSQKNAVLASFDDQSSDNVDEGDCVANYKQIVCDDLVKQCTVFWRFDQCYEKSEVTPAGLTYTCEVTNVASVKDLEDAFEQVMDCIQSTVTTD